MDKCSSSNCFSMVKWIVFLLAIRLGVSCGIADARQAVFAKHVHYKCSFTRYPSVCKNALLGVQKLGLGHQHVDLVSALVQKIRDETKIPTSNLQKKHQFEGLASQQVDVSIGHCGELMGMSLKRLNQALSALKTSPKKSKQDIQTWLSAALTFQESCKDSVKNLSSDLAVRISGKMDYLSQLSSNSLALANSISSIAKNTTSRRLSSDNMFPAWVSAGNRKLLQSPAIQSDAVVAQDGTGNYMTITDAIEAASGGRYVIYVKKGVYKEKIRINKDGITLIGDGKYSTIITGDDSVNGGSTMAGSATVDITGDGFIARDIGFQNTAGPRGEQALALRIASDHSVFYRCSLVGYQDTLYALALRQFYRECDIYGTIDFIFGNAIAIFQNCYLVLRRPAGKNYNVILANGRSDPGQNTGFAVQNCKIVAGSELSPVKHSIKSFLGRPWKEYSRSVIMQSNIDDAIAPRGWIEWEGNFALKTLYFAEYLNAGPGADTSGRVRWPGRQVIGSDEAIKYTVGKFIGGNSWLPSTGVVFDPGFI